MLVKHPVSLRMGASLAAALLVLIASPTAAHAAMLYQQLDTSALGETGAAHIGIGNPLQKLGSGLSGAIGSVAYKLSGHNLADDIAQGWGEAVLFECAPGGAYTSCNNRASSGFTPQILSQTGHSAYILVDMTQGGTVAPYPFNPELFYYLLWVTDQQGAIDQTNDLALYGSSSDTYPGGVAQWQDGINFQPEAHLADVAFRICDTAVCDLPSPVLPDIDPPVLGITIAATASTRPTITGTTNDPSLVSVHLNNKFYVAVPEANLWSVPLPAEDALLEGNYLVTASSTDGAGNSGTASGIFYVDITAPAIAITGGPADDGYASSTLISMAFDIADVHLENTGCSFDEAATSTCAITVSASLTDGGHKFAVEAKDRVGHTSYKSKHFTVDTASPTVSIDNRITNELAPVITGNHTDALSGVNSANIVVNGQTYNASILDSAWSTTLPNGSLVEGTYQVLAVATDRAGNTSPQVVGTLTIDRTAPTLAITGGFSNGAYTNMTAATFAFTSNTATVCSIDGGDFVSCIGTYSTSSLSSGTHLFTVSATDEAGNTTSQTRSWNIDTAAPILQEVAIATTTSDTTPQYKFSSSKPGSITYGGACSSASTTAAIGDNVIDFNPLVPGTYSNCTITVTDASGNISAPLAVSTFTITFAVTPKKHPINKDHCKVNGWRDFISPSFKNQGACVSYVTSHKGDRDKDEDGHDEDTDRRDN